MSGFEIHRRGLLLGALGVAVQGRDAMAANVADISQYQSYSLSNGVRVRLYRNTSGTVAGCVGMNYGALNDPVQGTAHLLEHVIYGNSRQYPEAQIRDFSARFAQINASTDLEWIRCSAGMLSDRVEDFLAFNASALFEPLFDDDHIRREKASVLEEIAFDDDEHDPVREVLYGAGHPLNGRVGGTNVSINSLDAASLRAFHGRGFHPGLVSIVLAGELPRDTEQWIEKHFGQVPIGHTSRAHVTMPGMLTEGHRIDDKLDDVTKGSARVEVAWNTGVTLAHGDVHALEAVNHFLGAYVYYSRLRQALGEKMPVAYSLESRYEPGMYASDFSVMASTTTPPDQLVSLLFDVFDSMKSKPISTRILPAFYDQWRYRMMVAMRSNEALRDMVFAELKTGISVRRTEQAYKSLTRADIQRAAQRYLPDRSGHYVLRISRSRNGD